MNRGYTYKRYGYYKTIVIGLFALFSVRLNAQTYLNVKFTGGGEQNSLIDSVKKITFSTNGDTIKFDLRVLGTVSQSLSSTQKLTFGASGSGGLLPVELVSFTAQARGKTVVLKWNTATEVNSASFEVERAKSTDWTKISSVKANGNSNSPKDYSFIDKNVNTGKYSYRLKMVDNDGSFEYSSITSVNLSAPKTFAVSQNYPNPFNPATTLSYQIPETGKVKIIVYDVNGAEVKNLYDGVQEAGYYQLQWDGRNSSGQSVASGVYMFRVQHNASVLNKKMLLMK